MKVNINIPFSNIVDLELFPFFLDEKLILIYQTNDIIGLSIQKNPLSTVFLSCFIEYIK
jgi:hypothetical protein